MCSASDWINTTIESYEFIYFVWMEEKTWNEMQKKRNDEKIYGDIKERWWKIMVNDLMKYNDECKMIIFFLMIL